MSKMRSVGGRVIVLTALARCGSACVSDNDMPLPPADASIADAGALDSGSAKPTFLPAHYADQWGVAACGYEMRCAASNFLYYDTSKEACIRDASASFLWIGRLLEPAIDANRVRFDEALFRECVTEFGSSDCGFGFTSNTSCLRFFEGQQGFSEPCFLDEECGPGLYCNLGGEAGSCGRCDRVAAVGEDCSARPCGLGSACWRHAERRACVAFDLPLDAPCGIDPNRSCRGSLRCVGEDGQQTCKRPGMMEGQRCDPTDRMFADCDYLAGMSCADGLCERLSFVGVGNSCGGLVQCMSDGFCPSGAGAMCTPFPREGEACRFDLFCDELTYCDSGTCVRKEGKGLLCVNDLACMEGLSCLGPRGGTRCDDEWRECD